MYGYNDIRERLAFAIPPFWQDILEAREFQNTSAQEFEKFWVEFYKFQDGRYPQHATSELVKWEMLLGLPSDEAGVILWAMNDNRLISEMEGQTWESLEFDYRERRSAVLSKLRGYGTITKARVVEIAAAYTGGAVTVTEYPGEYRVVIEFVDVQGVPEGLSDLQTIIRDMMPAHILVEFKLKYLRWFEFDAFNWKFEDLDAENLTWEQFDNLNPL